jgi:hypothetical protein
VPWVDLISHPRVVGMYADGTVQYDVPDLPVKGQAPLSVSLGVVSEEAAEIQMNARRDAFNAHREANELEPVEWINIGYVVDGNGLTAYYQLKSVVWNYTPGQVWTNWPVVPKVMADNA